MNTYTVKIAGQFEFTTDVEAESDEEAKGQAEVDMDFAMTDVETVIINSVRVVSKSPSAQPPDVARESEQE